MFISKSAIKTTDNQDKYKKTSVKGFTIHFYIKQIVY